MQRGCLATAVAALVSCGPHATPAGGEGSDVSSGIHDSSTSNATGGSGSSTGDMIDCVPLDLSTALMHEVAADASALVGADEKDILLWAVNAGWMQADGTATIPKDRPDENRFWRVGFYDAVTETQPTVSYDVDGGCPVLFNTKVPIDLNNALDMDRVPDSATLMSLYLQDPGCVPLEVGVYLSVEGDGGATRITIRPLMVEMTPWSMTVAPSGEQTIENCG
jgi:hypothetical protein